MTRSFRASVGLNMTGLEKCSYGRCGCTAGKDSNALVNAYALWV